MLFPSEFGSHIDKGILVVFQDIPAVPPGPGGTARLDPGGFGTFRKKIPVRFRSQGRDDVVPDPETGEPLFMTGFYFEPVCPGILDRVY